MTQPATLFARRDKLAAALRVVDSRLDAARREWSDAHGYRVPVRTEAFRQVIRESTKTSTTKGARS